MRQAETAPNSSRPTPGHNPEVWDEGPGVQRSGPVSVPRWASPRPLADCPAPFVLVAPAVLLIILVFRLYPLALGVNFSFTVDGERNGQAVGLDDYAILFDEPLFRQAMENVGLLELLLPIAVAIPRPLATSIYLRAHSATAGSCVYLPSRRA
jgi:multiple sugar transport system permease protein